MTSKSPNALFVVDGSNIATEGRTNPSLEQLNDAVLAFLDAHPGVIVTVVVDATFGHRIAKHEVAAFDEAVANNELVTPPAGAVGRGDAFVLAIADRAKAGILSNDSFQEFHGQYEWLFDEGRLIGGKPVPHVGWVFVPRTPVRGPRSRQSVRAAKPDVAESKTRAASRIRPKAANPKEANPKEASPKAANPKAASPKAAPGVAPEPAPPASSQVNDLVPFLEFVERHPLGTSCSAVIESYASHGAYARSGDVLIYLPLRLMADPPPRSARSALAIGEAVTAVVVGYTPDRRSIDAALPHMAAAAEPTGRKAAPAAVEQSPKALAKKPAAAPAKKAAKAPSSKKASSSKKAQSSTNSASKGSVAKTSAAKGSAAKGSVAKAPAAKAPAAAKAPVAKSPSTKAAAGPAKKAAKAPATKTKKAAG